VLDHQAHPPVIVRWGNGKTEIWEDDAPSISMQRAACAEKVIPIHSPRDCAGCTLRQPLVLADSIQTAEHQRPSHVAAASEPKRKSNRTRAMPQPAAPSAPPITPVQATQPLAQIEPPAPIAQTPPPQPASPSQPPIADKRSTVVAQKIIQLQEWLAKNVAQKKSAAVADQVKPVEEPRPRAVGEEKRVGWTD
jgi:hypothetical protein